MLPGLGESLSRTADRVLRQRGVEIRTQTSVAEADDNVAVRLKAHEHRRSHPFTDLVRRRAAQPLISGLGSPTTRVGSTSTSISKCRAMTMRSRVVTWRQSRTSPGPGEITPMDGPARAAPRRPRGAQHWASFGIGERRPYDLTTSASSARPRRLDLGGAPLHIPLSGLPAKVVARGYHLYSLPGNRGRTAASWLTETAFGRQGVQLGLVRGKDVPLTDTPMGRGDPTLRARER